MNDLINAIVEDRYEEAINEAKAIDKMLQSGSNSNEELERIKPLLGVPFTTKEANAVKGTKSL